MSTYGRPWDTYTSAPWVYPDQKAPTYPTKPAKPRTPVQEPESVSIGKLTRARLANQFAVFRFVELDKTLFCQLSDSLWHVSCDVCHELPEIGQIVGLSVRSSNCVFMVHKSCVLAALEEAPRETYEVIQDRLKNGGGLFE